MNLAKAWNSFTTPGIHTPFALAGLLALCFWTLGEIVKAPKITPHTRPEAEFSVIAPNCNAPAVQHRIAQIKADGFKVNCTEPKATGPR